MIDGENSTWASYNLKTKENVTDMNRLCAQNRPNKWKTEFKKKKDPIIKHMFF